MKFKYYGPNPGDLSEHTYQNRLLISEKNLCPTIDWRFRWYDMDEPRWEGFIGDAQIACLHRGGYSLHYQDIDEMDAWEGSDDSFFYYVYARILEVCFELCMVDLEEFIIERLR